MEKRVLIAFILSFGVLYAFRFLYSPPATPAESTTPRPVSAPVQLPLPPNPAPQESGILPAAGTDSTIIAEKSEDFVLETPLYVATLSNRGGVLKGFRLKHYTDGEGKPLELIDSLAGQKVGWPLALITGDKKADEELAMALFVARQDHDRVTLEYSGNGLHVQKVLQSDPDNYKFSVQTRVTKAGKDIPHSIVWQGGFGDPLTQDAAKRNAVYQVDANFKRINLRSVKDPQDLNSLKAGVDDQYFLAMFLIPDVPTAVKVRKQEYPGADQKPVPTLFVSAVAPQNKAIQVYIGPKQKDWLGKADPQLAAALDYGWWEFIARPLVLLLLWIHSYVGNFGWSIILLTLALNLVLFPLRLKQQVSMLKMQKIQPQMRRLQDQYKKLKSNDPKRNQVQTEMMGLYKEHGVNPMGGCLPLLLQMPLLFGFYSALAFSIELRRAPWILWVKDLSQPDYVFHTIPVLALLMTVSMFIQQKMTPAVNADPAQAKMMMIMPLMFTFMFWSQSSGLVLYWLTGSVIGIAQQFFINKYWSPQAESKLAGKLKPKDTDTK